jgi:hypothetical protein
MALQTFKEVIQNKGYRISSKDRAIFEKENLQSFFGLSDSDVIEFVVYDVNDNQLSQANYGLVRYIKLSTENIKDYILIPTGTVFQKYKFPKEYFIDVERLLKEAGYTNGIFKTQVTLLNKRAGSGEEPNNKLWISEISPSRTEIRLYPLKKGLEEYPELQQRFNIFTNNKNFREDTIYNISTFLEKIKADYVTELIKNKYTAKWFDALKSEFKIANFDEFATKIRNSFVQSSEYEFSNRFSTIGQPNYAQPKSTKQNLDLSVSDIKDTCKRILTETISHYLLYPDVKTKTTFDSGINVSNDYVTSVLQRNESDTIIDTSFPVLKQTTILKGPVTALAMAVEKEDPSKPTPPPIITEQPNPQVPSGPTVTNNPYGATNKKDLIDALNQINPFEKKPQYDPVSGLTNIGDTGMVIKKENPAKNPILIIDKSPPLVFDNGQIQSGGTTTGEGTTTGGGVSIGGGTTTTNPYAGIYTPPIQIAVGGGVIIPPILTITQPVLTQPVVTEPPYDNNPVIGKGGDLGGVTNGEGLGYDGYFGS